MDLKLQTRQTQTLSQRMIQSAEILQMTAQELNTYINETALENPVMKISDSSSGGPDRESIEQQQWLNSFNEENYYLYQRQNNDDDYDFKDSWNIDTDDGETLEDYLWSQLISEELSADDTQIIHYMLAISPNLPEILRQILKQTKHISLSFLRSSRNWTLQEFLPEIWKSV